MVLLEPPSSLMHFAPARKRLSNPKRWGNKAVKAFEIVKIRGIHFVVEPI